MDLEHKAIERLRLGSELSLQHYKKPLICTYSGGKDSDVLLELFKRAKIPFEVQHHLTTVDAPQTVYHVRKKFKELEELGIKCEIEKPELSMWKLIEKKKMPPTRIARYCCSYLKEQGGKNRMIATGVRKGESAKRSSRKEFEAISSKKAGRIVLTLLEKEKQMTLDEFPSSAPYNRGGYLFYFFVFPCSFPLQGIFNLYMYAP